jgi:uncharacterized damage-inducible protein DinB
MLFYFYFCLMKDYFIRLFEYDRYANQVMLETINKANNPDNAVKLMAHLLAAQQVWLNRCKILPPPGCVLWPDWQADVLAATIAENSAAWIDYVGTLQPEDFNSRLSYTNTRGEKWEDRLSDILSHVINHGTHHRAQIGQHLIAAGIEKLPTTDYIFYIRTLNHR